MIDYKKELEDISHLLKEEDYKLIISRTTWLMEQAFKNLFKDQLAYFQSLNSSKDEYQTYLDIKKNCREE
jgi:hypothetical protein